MQKSAAETSVLDCSEQELKWRTNWELLSFLRLVGRYLNEHNTGRLHGFSTIGIIETHVDNNGSVVLLAPGGHYGNRADSHWAPWIFYVEKVKKIILTNWLIEKNNL